MVSDAPNNPPERKIGKMDKKGRAPCDSCGKTRKVFRLNDTRWIKPENDTWVCAECKETLDKERIEKVRERLQKQHA
jgi:ribosomal protein L28